MTTAMTTCPVATPHTAPLRPIQCSCRCLDYLRHRDPAPSEPLALVRFETARTEADAVEHLHRATCYLNQLEKQHTDAMAFGRVDFHDAIRANDLAPHVDAARQRLAAIAQIVAQRWGVTVVIEHVI